MVTKRDLEDILNAPNSALEEIYRLKGYRVFGRIKRLAPKAIEIVRKELLRRNSEGEYIFRNNSERGRMRVGRGRMRTYC